MNKELGISNSKVSGNDVYKPCDKDPDTIIKRQKKELKSFHINVTKEQQKLPMLYFNSKQHKNPYKERFIAGASKCTTKSLSIEVSLALKLLKSQFKAYCNKIYKRTGINCFWSIENSNEFLQKIKNINKASSIHTFDFATLYTNLPLGSLQKSLQEFIMKMFNNSNQKFINIKASKKNAFWSDEMYNGHKIYTQDLLISAVNYLLENTFITYGPLLFQQTKGIPMGGNSSQDFADIYLIWKEFLYMMKLMDIDFELAKELSRNSRYIDDIATLNFEDFLSLANDIYDKELILEPSDKNGFEDDFLDINLKVLDNKFVTKIYHKVDKFNFEVVSFPFPDSNINSKIISNTFYSQLIRYLNICTHSFDFVSRFTLIFHKLKDRGFPESSLKKTLKKFILKNPLILEKYGFNNDLDCFEFCFNKNNTNTLIENSYTQTAIENSTTLIPLSQSSTANLTQVLTITNPQQPQWYAPPKLPNLGNTCYLNANMQIFILCNFYVNIQDTLNSNYNNSLDNIKTLLSSTSASLDQSQILSACKGIKSDLAKFEPSIFGNYQQQDAHEAFLKICNFLDEKTKFELFIPSQPDPLGQSYTSVIKQLFFGILTTTEICSSCNFNDIKSPDPFLNIYVKPSPNFNKNLVAEWNRKIQRKTCEHCHKNTQHLKTTVIHSRPNILVILFKRFKHLKTGRISKLNDQINLISELRIPGFSGKLIAYIEHLGATPYSGHYVSNIKIKNSWFSCSDTSIKPTIDPSCSQSVYLAFYKAMD